MKRRDTLKTLLVGTIGGAGLTTLSCKTDKEGKSIVAPPERNNLYGRTPEELEHDKKVMSETFFDVTELETIAILCDIILPATPTAGSATDAKVPDFIEFIVKDLPRHQLPIRGGLMWLDSESRQRFTKPFRDLSDTEQITIIEDIAYDDPEEERPEMSHGIRFFNLMRSLTLTGYYTTKMGLEDLGYAGNRANIWDGVPEEILKNHDVAYEPEWLAKCVDQENREVIAEWDAEGNLLT